MTKILLQILTPALIVVILPLALVACFNKDAAKRAEAQLGSGAICEAPEGTGRNKFTCARPGQAYLCVTDGTEVSCAPTNSVTLEAK